MLFRYRLLENLLKEIKDVMGIRLKTFFDLPDSYERNFIRLKWRRKGWANKDLLGIKSVGRGGLGATEKNKGIENFVNAICWILFAVEAKVSFPLRLRNIEEDSLDFKPL